MIEVIENWMLELLSQYESQRVSCLSLPTAVTQFFPESFLQESYYVETTDIPKPMIAEDIPGAEGFLALSARGITYKNTYFVLPGSSKSTHLHELVHVAQWMELGVQGFIESYIDGLQQYGYYDSPLEQMAYGIQHEFESGCDPFDILSRVKQEVSRIYSI